MRSYSGYLPSVPVRGGVGGGQGDVGVQLHGVRPLSLHNPVTSGFKFACKINSLRPSFQMRVGHPEGVPPHMSKLSDRSCPRPRSRMRRGGVKEWRGGI